MEPGKPFTYASPIPPRPVELDRTGSREGNGWLANCHGEGDHDLGKQTYQCYPCGKVWWSSDSIAYFGWRTAPYTKTGHEAKQVSHLEKTASQQAQTVQLTVRTCRCNKIRSGRVVLVIVGRHAIRKDVQYKKISQSRDTGTMTQ